MRAVCVLVVAVALLPARWTWAGETTARDVSEPTTRVVTVGELTRALQGAGGPAGAGGDDLRRGLLDVLQDAPHLHVLPQRRSLDPQQPLRLEVEDTGQAVSVTRAHLYRQRQHAAGQAAAPARGSQALRALHELESKSPAQLGSCTANATRKIPTNWKNQNYNLVSHGIVFGATTLSTGKTEVIAVVMRDPDMYKLEQWKNDQDDRNTAQISIDQDRIGFSIVKFDYQLGAACSSCWTSGVGAIGFQDGRKDAAIFSDRITSLAWYPTCALSEFRDGGANSKCAPIYASPGRPYFFQWIYVADSGNCRVRLVDYSNGDVRTRWGKDCVDPAVKDDISLYLDSPIANRNVLGSDLVLAWVSWKFLLVVDRDAHRIRKFVTSQHQGLSAFAGAYNTSACADTSPADGAGLSATFCRPEAVVVTADGNRAVVVEAVVAASWHDADRRLRVLDFEYSYLGGGDVGEVACTVSTLRRVTVALPSDAGVLQSSLFTRAGGMVLSPDGHVLIAGSADRNMLHYTWNQNSYNDGNSGGLVVALSLETGQMRMLTDETGAALHDATPVTALGAPPEIWRPDVDTWYQSGSNDTHVVFARHRPAAESFYTDGAGTVFSGIRWTNPVTSIETLVFSAADLALNCTQPAAASRRRQVDMAAPREARGPDTAVVGAAASGSGGREAMLQEEQLVVVDAEGHLRLVSSHTVRSLLQTSPNPTYAP